VAAGVQAAAVMSSDTQRVDWDALGALASAQSKAVVTELLNDAFECRHQHSGLTLSRRARLQSELGLPDAAAAVDRVRLLLPASPQPLSTSGGGCSGRHAGQHTRS
jgi:hypothetical protein